ncbi:hypothetical protein PRIPAC_83586, partial [Pristionchus pacificus]
VGKRSEAGSLWEEINGTPSCLRTTPPFPGSIVLREFTSHLERRLLSLKTMKRRAISRMEMPLRIRSI